MATTKKYYLIVSLRLYLYFTMELVTSAVYARGPCRVARESADLYADVFTMRHGDKH